MMLPRRALLDHQPGDVLGAEERAGQVDGELAGPALERHVEHAQAAEDARVVDEDVDAAQVSRTRATIAWTCASSVTSHTRPSASPPRRLIHAAHCWALSATTSTHATRAPSSASPLGDAAADVRAGAGHDRDLACELHASTASSEPSARPGGDARALIVTREGDYNRRGGGGQMMRLSGTLAHRRGARSFLLTSHACARRRPGRPPRLADLIRAYDDDVTPYYPFTASEVGLRQYDRVLANDIGEEYRSGMQALCTRYLARPAPRRRGRARRPERLAYDVFEHRLRSCLDGFRFPWHLLPVNQVGQYLAQPLSRHGCRPRQPSVQDRAELPGLPRPHRRLRHLDGHGDRQHACRRRARHDPAARVMLKVLPQLDAHIVDDPRTSLFYEPIRNFPAPFDEATRRRLTAGYIEAIREQDRAGLPAVADVHPGRVPAALPDVVRPQRPARRPRVVRLRGAVRRRRRTYAGRDLRPRASPRSRASAPPWPRCGRRSPPPGSRSSTRYRSIDELLKGYAQLRARRRRARCPSCSAVSRGPGSRSARSSRSASGRCPRATRPPSLDGARPGVFYLNSADVRSERQRRRLRNLFLHEAVPGHHFQVALQRENAALPGYRRFGWYTAFGEGWALYAESLGTSWASNATAATGSAMLGGELFRAAAAGRRRGPARQGLDARAGDRLPRRTDAGQRARGRALHGLARPGARLQDRPAQVPRTCAAGPRRRSAPAFDVRAFHDELLRDGAMPLSVLESKMDRWIAVRRRS